MEKVPTRESHQKKFCGQASHLSSAGLTSLTKTQTGWSSKGCKLKICQENPGRLCIQIEEATLGNWEKHAMSKGRNFCSVLVAAVGNCWPLMASGSDFSRVVRNLDLKNVNVLYFKWGQLIQVINQSTSHLRTRFSLNSQCIHLNEIT